MLATIENLLVEFFTAELGFTFNLYTSQSVPINVFAGNCIITQIEGSFTTQKGYLSTNFTVQISLLASLTRDYRSARLELLEKVESLLIATRRVRYEGIIGSYNGKPLSMYLMGGSEPNFSLVATDNGDRVDVSAIGTIRFNYQYTEWDLEDL